MGEEGSAVPVVSGNVSFYNQSVAGKSIPPSPVVACFGVMSDYAKAVTSTLREDDSLLMMLGARGDALGGSAYARQAGFSGGGPPPVDFAATRSEIEVVLDAVDRGWVRSCHDVSEGGLAMAAAEMALPSRGGVDLEIGSAAGSLRSDVTLFGERGGFLVEIDPEREDAWLHLCRARGAHTVRLGRTTRDRRIRVTRDNAMLMDLDLDTVTARWKGALREALR